MFSLLFWGIYRIQAKDQPTLQKNVVQFSLYSGASDYNFVQSCLFFDLLYQRSNLLSTRAFYLIFLVNLLQVLYQCYTQRRAREYKGNEVHT